MGITTSPELAAKIAAETDAWTSTGRMARLWARDASLWTGADESKWLGWLGIVDEQLASIAHLRDAAALAKEFRHVVVLGMGGSSLCPDVLSRTFGVIPGHPQLLIVDSTDPAQIRHLEARIDLARTIFVVSSKSGSTLEPNVFQQYFFDRVMKTVGAGETGRRFVAVTDPGSKVERTAETLGFARVFHGLPTIGGRYSALSDFGMVPAAMMGVDTAAFLERAQRMVRACAGSGAAGKNPGASLGIALGVLAKAGRDKLTITASPAISAIGGWLEQLIAESTGKLGKAIVPVDGETLAPPGAYGKDRVFAYVRLTSHPDAAQDAAIAALGAAGHPVVRIDVEDPMELGAEFFRWEVATAVAGSILGINPFDQPDVEASKIATKRLTAEVETKGSLPRETPLVAAKSMSLYADTRNAAALRPANGPADGTAAPGPDSEHALETVLAAHLARIVPGDYFGLLAYVEMSAAHDGVLQEIRRRVRDRKRVATCLGFGPRFLHSTGQAYKGGPNSGVFLQITCDDASDLPVPGQRLTFGVIKSAQARGDFEVLAERGRRALRVHLGSDVAAGLAELRRIVEKSLA